ncbi:hypothetical protein RCL1_001653 [Eukaryota sp. TZLM3-RCL]
MQLDLLRLPDGKSVPSDIVVLDLSKNRLSSVLSLSFFSFLEQLDLSHNQVSDLQNFTFPFSLTHVNLSFNSISLFNVMMSTNIRVLNLSHNTLTTLFGLKHCSALERLDVSHNHLSHLHGITSLNSLSYLNISFNHVSLYDLRVLAVNSNLKVLIATPSDASNLHATETEIKSFLRQLESLELVGLRKSPIIDQYSGPIFRSRLRERTVQHESSITVLDVVENCREIKTVTGTPLCSSKKDTATKKRAQSTPKRRVQNVVSESPIKFDWLEGSPAASPCPLRGSFHSSKVLPPKLKSPFIRVKNR